MDGTVITANNTLPEIQGKAPQDVDKAYKPNAAYKEFLGQAEPRRMRRGRIQRIGKGGKEVWIQASYNPILDLDGKPFKVVKYAVDIPRQKLINAEYQGLHYCRQQRGSRACCCPSKQWQSESTCGPDALARLMRSLPANFPVPVVIAQHMPPIFTSVAGGTPFGEVGVTGPGVRLRGFAHAGLCGHRPGRLPHDGQPGRWPGRPQDPSGPEVELLPPLGRCTVPVDRPCIRRPGLGGGSQGYGTGWAERM
jgi:hypothetical protein